MKRCIEIFLLFIIVSLDCYSQKIDSLQKILPALQDSARVNCLNALSEALVSDDYETSNAYALKALQLSQRINYSRGSAIAYYNLASLKWSFLRDFQEMETYCHKSIELLEKKPQENELMAKAYFMMGCAYMAKSAFSLAIEAYSKAEQFYLKIPDEINAATTYSYRAVIEDQRGHYEESFQYYLKWLKISNKSNQPYGPFALAPLYRKIGDYETALKYYRQAEENTRANNINSGGIVYLMMGETFYLQGKYDSATYYYRFLINNLKYNRAPSRPYSRLGEVYLALKVYDTALMYLNDALKDFKNQHDCNQTMWVLIRLGRAYKETKSYRKAIQISQELLQLAEQTGARQNARDAHFLLYELFDSLQKKDSAYLHLKKYTIIKDSIDIDLSAQKLGFHKIQTETEKAQFSISLLNNEKKLQQEQLKQTALQKRFLIAAIIAVLLIAVVLIRNISLKRKNEKLRLEHEVELKQLEIQKSTAEFQKQTSELEMQALRAQMNPHFIFNSLNSINRFILQNNKAQASEYLTKFSRLVRLILQNSQSALIPLESELESLQLYLELEAVRFDHHFEFTIKVENDLDISDIKVPPLIIQPYTENAIWHGLMHKEEMGHLEVELFKEQDMLCCKITDDGIGRKKASELKSKSASAHKSMGMRITAERIAILQQKTQSDTSIKIIDLVLPDGSAAGTEVLLKIPIQYD